MARTHQPPSRLACLALLAVAVIVCAVGQRVAIAQPADGAATVPSDLVPAQGAAPASDFAARFEEAARRAQEAIGSTAPADSEGSAAKSADAPAAVVVEPDQARAVPKMNLLELAIAGGPLMIPITIMSIVVVMFAIERALALRKSRVVPSRFVEAINLLAVRRGGIDPRLAYRVCNQYPSPAATVVKAALLKVGRPHAEVEKAVTDANERVAAAMYKNVRPIELAVGVTPLLGLLGTVQGMIMAFYQTAAMEIGADRAAELATGIYVALVTTFGGLCVAIPASMLAHFFEGRIQAMIGEIDELLSSLLPQLEKYEGKVRLSRKAKAATEVKLAQSEEIPFDRSAAAGGK